MWSIYMAISLALVDGLLGVCRGTNESTVRQLFWKDGIVQLTPLDTGRALMLRIKSHEVEEETGRSETTARAEVQYDSGIIQSRHSPYKEPRNDGSGIQRTTIWRTMTKREKSLLRISWANSTVSEGWFITRYLLWGILLRSLKSCFAGGKVWAW
jgi:hypothetical protein